MEILLNKYPAVGLLDHMVVLFLVLWGVSILLSIEAVPFYISLTLYKGSNLFITSPTLIFFVFDNNHLNRYEVAFHCGFDLNLFDDS